MTDQRELSDLLNIVKPAQGENYGEEYWEFVDIVDAYEAKASMFFSEEQATTPIATQGSWEVVEGPAQTDIISGFTFQEAANTLEYDGDMAVEKMVSVTMSVTGTQNNTSYEVAVFDDGQFVDTTVPFDLEDGETLPLTINHLVNVEPGDYYTLRVRCTSGTDDIVFNAMSFNIY